MPVDSISSGPRIPTSTTSAAPQTQSSKDAQAPAATTAQDSFATDAPRLDPSGNRVPVATVNTDPTPGSSVLNTRINNYVDSTSAAQINWSTPRILPPSGQVSKPRPQVLQAALKAYDKAAERHLVQNPKLTIIDYSLPSTQARLWVLDMAQKKLVAQHLVAHGRKSGDPQDLTRATSFSNRNNSNQSCLGVYTTAETYHGNHGYSLRLDGQERNFNGNMRERAIVIHGADYATQDFVNRNGYLGRSLGCPALDQSISSQIIDVIKDKSLVFAYADDNNYLDHSEYLS